MNPEAAPDPNRKLRPRHRFVVSAVLLAGLMLGTCSRMPGTLEQVTSQGTIKVVTRNSPLAYYEGAAGPEGPEYELARAFAARLGVRLELRVARTAAAAIAAVARNRAHIGAAGLVVGTTREERIRFAPPFQHIDHHVVYRVQDELPRTPADLVGLRIAVQRGSRHAASLARLARQFPGLRWTAARAPDSLALLDRVARGDVDVTIADSIEFSLGRHFYPDLRPAFKLPGSEAVAWALSPHGSDLMAEVEGFFSEVGADGRLDEILGRNRRALVRFDRVDAAGFVASVRERLPAYRPWFEEAAAETGIDWRLLAAVGYQESRWDETAVSPTGVQGLMMLTSETAQRVGVGNRADARESIIGGARYLRLVEQTIPARIPEPDRTWLTLAAYNVGYGHLEDARILTQRRGQDPDRWPDVQANLPLLAQERFYTTLKRGYARGWEPVGFVRNVQTYAELLRWMNPDSPQSAAPGKETAQ